MKAKFEIQGVTFAEPSASSRRRMAASAAIFWYTVAGFSIGQSQPTMSHHAHAQASGENPYAATSIKAVPASARPRCRRRMSRRCAEK